MLTSLSISPLPIPPSSISVAAVDLDDTLLGSNGTLSVRTAAALRNWQASGRRLVIATGRPTRAVHRVLPAELHTAPLISYNGAEIYLDGRKIYENLITPDVLRPIIEDVQSVVCDVTIGLEIHGELYLNRAMDRPSPYHIADLLELCCHPAAKVLLFGNDFTPLTSVLTAVPTTAKVLYSTRYHFIQILAGTVDKAEALRALAAGWGIDLTAMAAFGDDTNDVEMVQACGLGVAMANAVAEVKAVAAYITRSNDEDGVALVLERLLVGEPLPATL
jgi:Cof subfamily protein (haloacid dehalogenase superfamily)